jgi:hypothetical protein
MPTRTRWHGEAGQIVVDAAERVAGAQLDEGAAQRGAEPCEVVACVERQLGEAGREMLGAVALVHEAEREVDEAHVARPWLVAVSE